MCINRIQSNIVKTLLDPQISFCVPIGNSNKNANGFWKGSIRLPEFYNCIYQHLKSLELKKNRT